MSEAEAADGGEVEEVSVGLGRSLRLRPPPPALLVPEVPVLEEDDDNLDAMVSLGDEIGLNVE